MPLPPLQGGATANWADQQGRPLPRVASAARRLAWERLARSLHFCVSSSHRSSSFGPNCSRGSFSRTTRYTWDRVIRGIFPPIPAASPAGMPRPAGTWRYGDASPPSSGSRIRPAPRRPSQSRTPFQCATWKRPRTPGSPGSAFWGIGQIVARLAAVQVTSPDGPDHCRCNSGFLNRITDTIMPHKTIIRPSGVARNPANGFPARLLGDYTGHCRRSVGSGDVAPEHSWGGRNPPLVHRFRTTRQPPMLMAKHYSVRFAELGLEPYRDQCLTSIRFFVRRPCPDKATLINPSPQILGRVLTLAGTTTNNKIP